MIDLPQAVPFGISECRIARIRQYHQIGIFLQFEAV
jgi:hypothetical protein